MVRVEVDARDVKERKADGKGRVALGPQYAHEQVEVAVVAVVDDDVEEQSAD